MMRRGVASWVVAGSLCAGVTACGSSHHPAASAGRNPLAFSECVRAHGVRGFPDPGDTGASTGSNTIMIAGIVIPPSIDIQSPAVRSAFQSCQKELFPNGRPKVSSSQKEQLIVQAQCMRTHGVPGFPDPQFPTSGGILISPGTNVTPDSPAFQAASKACGGA